MKKIKLTQGKCALVDDDDYEWLKKWKWQAHKDGYSGDYYATRREPRQKEKKTRGTVIMAREIMKTPDGMVCDHINHNTLDNRKQNLRNCTHAQNMKNHRGAYRNSTTKVLGVSKFRNGFRANLSVDGKQLIFPVRKTLDEAKEDRTKAEKEYFGNFSPGHKKR